MNMTFQVTDAKKPLLSVRRVVEKGNHVHFGPTAADGYISNPQTGKKLPLKFDGKGTWVMEVEMSGEKTHITVDSGAADSVSPMNWGNHFPLQAAGSANVPKRTFVAASGKLMAHHGQRTVQVHPF